MARVSADTKQATRERLLEAAAREFARRGLERANIDAISLAAGFAKGTVYNYFASKDDLFLAVVDEACARATASASAPPRALARDRLRVTLAAFCDWAGANEGFARVLVRECLMGTPELHARMAGAEEPLLAELEATLRDGSARGELRDDLSPELLALALAGLTDLALAQHWSSDGASPALDQIPELVLGLLLGARSPAATAS
jgi:AcrR family transcriptional regulator